MEQSEPSIDHGSLKDSGSTEHESTSVRDHVTGTAPESNEVEPNLELQKTEDELKKQEEDSTQEVSTVKAQSAISDDASEMVLEESNINAKVEIVEQVTSEHQADIKEQGASSERNLTDNVDSLVELEKAKADEIAKMNENEQLKSLLDVQVSYPENLMKLKSSLYEKSIIKGSQLLKERFVLSRGKEIPYVCVATALLKGKYEIITQVMAEGEELSKKQAAQESQIRKLRAQIREFEEEKKGLTTTLQAEENKVDV